MSRTLTFTLPGKIPSKKNRWHPRKGGGIYADRVWMDYQDIALVLLKRQAKTQGVWETNEPISFSIHVRRMHKRLVDLDNSLTGVLDLAQKAGLIPNDGLINHYSECSRTLGDVEDSVVFSFTPSPIPLYGES